MPWDPYVGMNVSENIVTREHILPLSMGGNDAFVIRVSKSDNSALGANLDVEMANNSIILFARHHYGMGGQSRSIPTKIWETELRDLPGRLDFSQATPVFQSFRSKAKYALNVHKRADADDKFEMAANLDIGTMFSWACKACLGTAWYLYGETFRLHGYHDELRRLMKSPESIRELSFMMVNQSSSFWARPWPWTPAKEHPAMSAIDHVCAAPDCHVVVSFNSVQEQFLCISLFSGMFRWYWNIAGNPEAFPSDGENDLGTVLEVNLTQKTLVRESLRSRLLRLREGCRPLSKGTPHDGN